MNNEYIIINKIALQKRIEDLRQVCNKELGYASDKIYFELDNLLSDSTPLIPEIEKAFDAGNNWGYAEGADISEFTEHINKEDYVLNLKLDI